MNNLPVVLVDMDGVLADYDSGVLKIISERHPDIIHPGVRKNFYINDDFGQHSDLVKLISDEEGFFLSLDLAPGAIEGWQRLIDMGYHPVICSSPKLTNPYCVQEKLEWLRRHFVPIFGENVIDEAIITRNKHEFDGIVLIDDRPEVLNAEQAAWRHVVFDMPYNRHINSPRLNGWTDENLNNLLISAAAGRN